MNEYPPDNKDAPDIDEHTKEFALFNQDFASITSGENEAQKAINPKAEALLDLIGEGSEQGDDVSALQDELKEIMKINKNPDGN